MPELSLRAVVACLSSEELVDAIDTCLDQPGFAEYVWPIIDELERREPTFAI